MSDHRHVCPECGCECEAAVEEIDRLAAPRSVETAGLAIRSYQLWDRESGNLLDRYDPDLYSVIGIDQDGHPHRLVVSPDTTEAKP